MLMSKAEKEVLASFADRKDEFVDKVRKFMIEPPTLCSSAGQLASKAICIRRVNNIVAKCKAEGTQFTDPDFPLQSNPNECLYVDHKEPGWDCTVAPPARYV